ncbi:MAG: fibronectin type III domain-containing protein [Patescibacteria group bacterium]
MKRAIYNAGKKLMALLGVAVLVIVPVASRAVQATPASDTLTAFIAGQQSDHTVKFKAASGIDDPADTVTLYLPDFVFGSVGLGDIDLHFGPVTGLENSATIAALPAVGVWGLGIAGQLITFTAPSNAAPGTIPTGDFIVIRIGTNTGGVNQLTNPAAPQVAQITINGTFGGWNMIAVPILDNDSMSVTAIVPQAASTTTPPEPPPGGGTAPAISGIQVINITSNAATVIWVTDQNSNSEVSYGFTLAHASGTITNATQVQNHSLTINGLSSATLYHFIVKSTNASFLSSQSGDQTFVTLGDVTPPLISNIQVININDTSALVTWDTDEPATTRVDYGLDAGYGSQGSAVGYQTSHSVQLNGLTPGTTYHFRVASTDNSGNPAQSPDGTFVTTHDVTPPANVQNFSAAAGDTTVTLTWNNPPDVDFAGTKILRKLGSYPTGPTDGDVVYIGSGVTTLDNGLTNGVTYYYAAYAFDTNGNFASGALAQATPQGPPLPPIPPAPTTTPPIPPQPPLPPQPPSPPVPPQPPIPPAPTTTPPIPPIPPVPPVTTGTQPVIPIIPTPEAVTPISVHFYTDNGTIELVPDSTGSFGALAGTTVTVSVPLAGLGSLPDVATVSIGSSLYSLGLSKNGTEYTGTFVVPQAGKYPVITTVVFKNGTVSQVQNTLVAQLTGAVLVEPLVGTPSETVEGAKVQLFHEVNGVWVPYGAPQTSGSNGKYGYTVPNGRFYAVVEKDGFRKKTTNPIFVERNVYNENITLIKEPVVVTLPPEAPIAEKVQVAAAAAVQNLVYTAEVIKEIFQTPEVQLASDIATPSLLAVSLINIASSLSAFNFLAYFQYLFTQPILIFGRRRKKKWGFVYNSLSKQPVDLAVVRLVHFESRLVVQTMVTDRFGRFRFLVKQGDYYVEVVKPGYTFPSAYLKDKTEDVDYVDLYHGGKFAFSGDGVIALTIPLDPVAMEETPKGVLFRSFLHLLRKSFAISGIVLGSIILVVRPSIVNLLLLILQFVLYFLFKRLGAPVKPRKWGTVIDAKTHKPVANAIVRIFDKKFNKLLEMQVTGARGAYGFFVRRNIYFLTVDKLGYVKHISNDIDLQGKDEALIDQNIYLEPDSGKTKPKLTATTPKPSTPAIIGASVKKAQKSKILQTPMAQLGVPGLPEPKSNEKP